MTRKSRFITYVQRTAVILAIAVVALAAPLALTVETAHAQTGIQVSNHVFTTRVIRAEDGTFFVQDVLVGFERGTATFQTLTQVVLPRGSHRITLALVDPGGKELSRVTFPTIQATSDKWTQTLQGTWQNIRFSQAGVHTMVVYHGNDAVARFHLIVE